ncbi:EAL domain-containing protein [Stenotrophomonas rhizophila]|uniref:cyclic-guanylate-specific phosphodiesterase n=1 Tax=Stenotrophomonas rhizophila TaxID=216778 RepID=A0AAW5PFU2_9GAMM|nr:EAL domain-containing protein [Stenotrophomonas rhizophila]MCS4279170.1 sensor c-di-GMP phosphodiesterase-like protein [Stenotrophomonas rhizophila]
MSRSSIAHSYRIALEGRAPFVTLTAVVVLAVTLLTAQAMLVQRDRAVLDAYADRLLSQAEAVAAASTLALDQAAALVTAPCTSADLAELRLLAFKSRYVRDVGRLQDDRLVCSAAWGVLAAPARMPEPDRRVRGYRLWGSVSGIVDSRVAADMSAKGDVIVTTSPSAFDRVDQLASGMGALLLTRDAGHVFQRFGDVTALDPSRQEAWSDLGSTRHSRRCSATFDICVAARARQSSLLSESPWIVIGLCLLGGFAGSGLGLLISASQRNHRSLPKQLERAILGDGLTLVYQPLRTLSDRRLVGVETLSRWCNEQGEPVPPDTFVPMAERQRLGGALARQVVRKALAELGDRLRDDPTFYVSFNVSATDVVDAAFRAYLNAATAQSGIARQQVVLEITERSTTRHHDLADGMTRLREDGYPFYIDDFGTGYSNFAYLAELPLDAIKMDQRFTRAIGTGSAISQIIEAICVMTRTLDIGLVVEGVETEEQAQVMVELMPSAVAQGWLLGRPVPVDALPVD